MSHFLTIRKLYAIYFFAMTWNKAKWDWNRNLLLFQTLLGFFMWWVYILHNHQSCCVNSLAISSTKEPIIPEWYWWQCECNSRHYLFRLHQLCWWLFEEVLWKHFGASHSRPEAEMVLLLLFCKKRHENSARLCKNVIPKFQLVLYNPNILGPFFWAKL